MDTYIHPCSHTHIIYMYIYIYIYICMCIYIYMHAIYLHSARTSTAGSNTNCSSTDDWQHAAASIDRADTTFRSGCYSSSSLLQRGLFCFACVPSPHDVLLIGFAWLRALCSRTETVIASSSEAGLFLVMLTQPHGALPDDCLRGSMLWYASGLSAIGTVYWDSVVFWSAEWKPVPRVLYSRC